MKANKRMPTSTAPRGVMCLGSSLRLLLVTTVTTMTILSSSPPLRGADAFALPMPYTRRAFPASSSTAPYSSSSSSSSSLHATPSSSSAGEALKRGVKFLLVPNAKQPAAVSAAPVPPAPVPPAPTPVPAPVVVAQQAPPPVPVVETLPPPPPPPAPMVVAETTTTTTTTPPPPPLPSVPETDANGALPPTIKSLLPDDFFWRTHNPLQGMQADASKSFSESWAPPVPPPEPPALQIPDTSDRWDAAGFSLKAWIQSRLDMWKAPMGPRNVADKPKLLEHWDVEGFQQGSLRTWQDLQANVAGGSARARQLSQQAGASYQAFAASVADVTALVEKGQPYSTAEFEKALNLPQTASWYLVVLGTFGWLCVNMASPTTTAKSPPVGTAAAPAPANVAKAANAVLAADKEIAKREAQVVAQVDQLTQATKLVTEQLADLQSAKAKRDYDVATMKSDMRELRNLLGVTQRAEMDLRESLARTQSQLESETLALKAQLQERMAAEAAVRQQLEETKADMKAKIEAAGAAQSQAEKVAADAQKQVAALEQEKAAMAQEIAALQAQVDALQAKATTSKAAVAANGVRGATKKEEKETPSAPPVVAKAAPKAVAKKKKAAKKKKQAQQQQPSEEVVLESLSSAFFANISEPVGAAMEPAPPSSPPPPQAAVKKATRKMATPAKKKAPPKAAAVATTAPPTAAHTNNGDWSALSPSALKRKTVKDLQAYLSSNVPGAKVTGPDGKALKKDVLVEQILSAV